MINFEVKMSYGLLVILITHITKYKALTQALMALSRGNRPLRACGTRFVTHKVAALGRLIDRYGAYLAHLTSLIEDPKVKSVDKEKLRGYIRKWRDTKMLLGCALFHDMLKPCAVQCTVLQEDEVGVVGVIESLLKTKKS